MKKDLKYYIKIKDLPPEERPREKLIKYGIESLSNAELLAILLGSGTKDLNVVDLSKQILTNAKGLANLSSHNLSDLKIYKGIGEAKALTLISAFELGRRAISEKERDNIKIISPEDVVNFAISLLYHKKKEVFKVIFLNRANLLIGEKTISEGGLSSLVIEPRDVFKEAITQKASAVILVHNHPSGDKEPSEKDIEITESFYEAGKILEIPVLDHLIIAGKKYFSFRQNKLVFKYEK